MLKLERDGPDLHVDYRYYLLPALPPLLLIEHGARLVDATIDASNFAGLALGVALPLACAWFFIEFGRFTFSRPDGVFAWHWRNLVRSERGVVSLARIVDVRREGYETRGLLGRQPAFRLVVELIDRRVVGLSHAYSGFQRCELERIVAEIRDYLPASSTGG